MTRLTLLCIDLPWMKPYWLGERSLVALELSLLARIFVNSFKSELDRAIGLQLARSNLSPFLKRVIIIDSVDLRRSIRSVMQVLKSLVSIGVISYEKRRYTSKGIPSGPGDLFLGEVLIASLTSFVDIG